jgi:alcohol dehydrogenase class IV
MNLAFEQNPFSMGTKVEYGPNVYKKVGGLVKKSGRKKAMLVTDSNLVKAGLVDKVSQSIREKSIAVEIFDRVQTEPTDEIVHRGVDVLKKTGCDSLVAVGGGSTMDAAKCIGVMAENPGHVVDYEGAESNFPNASTRPLITLPTKIYDMGCSRNTDCTYKNRNFSIILAG